MFNDGGEVDLTNSTLAANAAVGGAGGAALGTGFPGSAGQGMGGAIFSRSGSVALNNATIAGNGADAGGGLFVLADGSINATPAVFLMYNTIVAGSAAGTNDIDTATFDGGSLSFVGSNDLIQTEAALDGFPVTTNIVTGQDPLLGPLADNGGPTSTMSLLPGSPAIDAGSNAHVIAPASGGAPTDQRGQPRIVNGGSGQKIVDLGAYELSPLSTTVSISASDAAPTLGEAVTFTVDVTGTSTDETPTGTVQLFIDGRPLGGPLPLVGGTASSVPDATLRLGPHTVTAQYVSDAEFASGMGTLAGNFAVRAATGTTVAASTASLAFGQPVTFTATVSDLTLGAGAPAGFVDFTDATTGVDFGTGEVINGVATLSPFAPLGVGTHEIVATYLGNSEFFGSASAPQATVVSVVPAPTTTTAAVSMPSTVYGPAVTFTASVTSALGTPVGAVDFYDLTTGTDLGTVAAGANGVASTPPITLGIGTNLIGDDVQVISWGDGSGVPTTGNNLVIVGVDSNNLLHIRIFDGGGNDTDTDETQLPAEAALIATLKQQLPGYLAQTGLSLLNQAQVLNEVRAIVGPTHLIAATYLGGGGFAGSFAQVTETVSSGTSATGVTGNAVSANAASAVAGGFTVQGTAAPVKSASAAATAPGGPVSFTAAVDDAIESDFGAGPGPAAIPTGLLIRARQSRVRIAGDVSQAIDNGNERSVAATDEVLDRLAGDINGGQSVDDEDINQIVAARLVRSPGPRGGRSVEEVGLGPMTRARRAQLSADIHSH